MENYDKGETTKISEDCLPLSLSDNTVKMRVSYGSKIRNLMGFAMKKIKDPEVSCMTWEGSGNAISKTVTCAEIMKRKIQGLHQFNYGRYKRIEEYWEPKEEGLDRLKVNRDIPVLTIVLSKEPLDTTLEGYQKPGTREQFWGGLDKPERRPGKSGQQREPRGRRVPLKGDSSRPAKQPKKDKRKEKSTPGGRSENKVDSTTGKS